MARKFAQILVTIWDDDDFLDLAAHEQWLYLHLATHADLTYTGVMDWRPRKITPKAADLTLDDITVAAGVLAAKHYLVIDEDTEEVLVRSFMRNDGLLKQKNMGAAVAKAYSSIGSRTLSGVVVHELRRLHTENPNWGSWDALSNVLAKRSLDPSEIAPANPLEKGSVIPFGMGSRKVSGGPSDSPPNDPPF